MSPETAQAKHAVDVLLDAFDDATDAGDRVAMEAVMARLRPAFSAYQQACARAGVTVDPQTVGDCKAASETLRTGARPAPARPADPVPAPRPAAPAPAYEEELDDEPGLGYGGGWMPPADEDDEPPMPARRPAPAARRPVRDAYEDAPAPARSRRPAAPAFADEDEAPAPARSRRPAGDEELSPVIALLDNKRLLYGVAGALAAVVFAALSFGIVVALLLACAVIVPAVVLMRRQKAPSAKARAARRPAPVLDDEDEGWDEQPAVRRRRR